APAALLICNRDSSSGKEAGGALSMTRYQRGGRPFVFAPTQRTITSAVKRDGKTRQVQRGPGAVEFLRRQGADDLLGIQPPFGGLLWHTPKIEILRDGLVSDPDGARVPGDNDISVIGARRKHGRPGKPVSDAIFSRPLRATI